MPIDFPNTPTTGEIFSAGNYNWIWTGTTWNSYGENFVALKTVNNSYSLISSDKDKMIEIDVGSANTVTIPTDTELFSVGSQVHLIQIGLGQTQIVPASGVSVVSSPGLFFRDRYSAVTLVKRASNSWAAVGDLSQ